MRMFCNNESCEHYELVINVSTVKEWNEVSNSFEHNVICNKCGNKLVELPNIDFTSINMINKGANKVNRDHKTIY